MLEADMIAAVKRGCRNSKLSSSDISAVLLRGVTVLGMMIKQVDPSYFLVRKSLTSLTHVFTKPTDCLRIEKIWDLGTNAGTVTGAADNGSGLVRMTVSSHGFSDDDIVTQHDIAGTTEANGIFKITYVDDDTYDLQGSTFANTYTSGGYAFKPPASPLEIKKTVLPETNLESDLQWYPRGGSIIVDDKTFTNDILIDYQAATDDVTDIPSEYHEGLVAFGVINLIRMPKQDSPDYGDFVESKNYHQAMYAMVAEQIEMGLKASSEPTQMRNIWDEV
jgi:hypothetical protein